MDNLGRPVRLPRPVNACLPRSRGRQGGMREDRAKERDRGGSGRARGSVGSKVKADSGDGWN